MVEKKYFEFDPLYERHWGSVVGAFCGDAAGGTLEFFHSIITEKNVEEALEMKGGGALRLGPGQITDDSELALCLGYGLVAGKGEMNLDEITRAYGEWVHSHPFDIGFTTRKALGAINPKKPSAKDTKKRAEIQNMDSKSNGCLMRITPLAIWCYKLSDEEIDKAVRADVSLTHSNNVPQEACVAYCICLKHLIENKGDRKSAFEHTEEYVKGKGYKTIMGWMEVARAPKGTEVTDCNGGSIGYVMHGFIWAMHLLFNGYDFEEAMKLVLLQGGDTDTNACIVGGLIGAADGGSKLPPKMVKKLMTYDYEKMKGIYRPNWLNPGKSLEPLLKQLLDCAPDKLKIVPEF